MNTRAAWFVGLMVVSMAGLALLAASGYQREVLQHGSLAPGSASGVGQLTAPDGPCEIRAIDLGLQAQLEATLSRGGGAWHIAGQGTAGGETVEFAATLQPDGTWSPELPRVTAGGLGPELLGFLSSAEFVRDVLNDGPEIQQLSVSWQVGTSAETFGVDTAWLAQYDGVATTRFSERVWKSLKVTTRDGRELGPWAWMLGRKSLEGGTFELTLRASATVSVPPFATVTVEATKTVRGPIEEMDEIVSRAQAQVERTVAQMAQRLREQLEQMRDSLKGFVDWFKQLLPRWLR